MTHDVRGPTLFGSRGQDLHRPTSVRRDLDRITFDCNITETGHIVLPARHARAATICQAPRRTRASASETHLEPLPRLMLLAIAAPASGGLSV